MTYALSDTSGAGAAGTRSGPELSAAAARLARIVELTRLLGTVAHAAADRFGAAYLLVDRTGNTDVADLKVLVDGDRLVDLWDLDPILWDDAHWAAVRLVEMGEVRIIRPDLHGT